MRSHSGNAIKRNTVYMALIKTLMAET